MKWYHGTSSFLAENILKEGFKLNPYEGIWGCGVYLTDKIEEAKTYGDTILFAYISEKDILHIDYHKDMPNIFPDLSFEEEEACRLLREHTLDNGYLASSVRYGDGCRHVIVYDTTAFTFIDLDEQSEAFIA